jgi:hypothetical protein
MTPRHVLLTIVGVFVLLPVLLLVSCAVLPERNPDEDKIFAEVIGFSDSVTVSERRYHLTETNSTGQEELGNTIQGLPLGQNTAIYYAVDRALDRIEAIYKNTPPNELSTDPRTAYYTKYYIILFTDGMDNVSTQLARNDNRGKYANTTAYANAIRERMNTIFDRKWFGGLFTQKTKRLNTFDVYLLGLKGQDLMESGYEDEDLIKSLRPLMGSYRSVTHEPIVSDAVGKIYDDFEQSFTTSAFSFYVPKGYADNKYRIKMELAAEGDEGFPYFFEANIIKEKASGFNALLALFGQAKKETYVLKNIARSEGLTFDGLTIEESLGTPESSPTVEFILNNLRFNNNPLKVENVQQSYNDGAWRRNSEYKSDTGQSKNAYVLLVLDRSSSLNAEDKEASEKMAINIVNLIGNWRD